MTDTPKRRFSKRVRIAEKDADNRTVTGAALVPWEVDRQGDWLDPDGVRAMYNPDPDDGVMHAVFPDDDAETVESYVTDEPVTLGGEEYAAGTWVIRRRYDDDDLWALVESGVLSGFSIGGSITQEDEDIPVDELPDEVTFPPGVDEAPATKLINGATDEVSDVDIPAVPSAIHATAKSVGKSIYDESTDREEFVETMEERGHETEDAEELFEYLDTAAKVGPAGVVEKFGDSQLAMDGQKQTDPDVGDLDGEDVGFLKWLRRTVGRAATDAGNDAPADPVELTRTSFAKAADVVKEGRTLNQSNREALMAAHDAVEAALASDMDIETNRFSDNDEYEFTLTDYEDKGSHDGDDEYYSPGKSAEKLTVEQGDHVVDAIEEFLDTQGDATFAEFREWTWHKFEDWDSDKAFAVDTALDQYATWTREMHDTLDVTEEFAPWLAEESNIDTETTDITMSDTDPDDDAVKALEKRIEELEAEIEKDNDGADDDGGDGVDKDARIDELEERVDKLSKETTESDQLGGTDGADESTKSAIELEKEVFTG